MDDYKSNYIQNLEEFLKKNDVCQRITLEHLAYVKDFYDEWLYVMVGKDGQGQKRLNITANSNEATTRAFFEMLKRWNEFEYLQPGSGLRLEEL